MKELKSDFFDRKVLADGAYMGRIRNVYAFTSKNGKDFVAVVVGIRMNYEDGPYVFEVSRIFTADYYTGSFLYNFAMDFNIVEGRHVNWNKLENSSVEVEVSTSEKSKSQYIEKIMPAESLAIDQEFTFERITTIEGTKFEVVYPEGVNQNEELKPKINPELNICQDIDLSDIDEGDDKQGFSL